MHRNVLSRVCSHVRSSCMRQVSMFGGEPKHGSPVAEPTDDAPRAPAFYPPSFWLEMYATDAQEWLREHNKQWWREDEKNGTSYGLHGADYDDYEIATVGQISKRKFVEVLWEILGECEDEVEFDCSVWLLIEEAKRRPSCSQEVVQQITPAEYAQFVTSFPTHEFCRHIGCRELKEIMHLCPERLILFDVRNRSEREASTVRGAYVLEVERDLSDEYLYQINPLDLDRTCEFLSNILERDEYGEESEDQPHGLFGSHVIVTFCNTGLRGAAAAISLSEELDYPVHSLCGGLINYFNSGGELVGQSDEPTSILHPGSTDLIRFVTRENLFGVSKHKANDGVPHQV
ncbi:hypothetical protein BSKO_04106 [Bryopsis sp. KO-2023]|nr:hypothetical protein BSKO_04106 [Bryopsis sp. KO-2023]